MEGIKDFYESLFGGIGEQKDDSTVGNLIDTLSNFKNGVLTPVPEKRKEADAKKEADAEKAKHRTNVVIYSLIGVVALILIILVVKSKK